MFYLSIKLGFNNKKVQPLTSNNFLKLFHERTTAGNKDSVRCKEMNPRNRIWQFIILNFYVQVSQYDLQLWLAGYPIITISLKHKTIKREPLHLRPDQILPKCLCFLNILKTANPTFSFCNTDVHFPTWLLSLNGWALGINTALACRNSTDE